MITLLTMLLTAAPQVTIVPIMASVRPICAERCIGSIEAVTLAAQVGNGAGVAGDFGLTVKAIGFERGRFYLNSELDYRDRNCLTVVVPTATMARLVGTADPEEVKKLFVGSNLKVRGVASQVRIDFTTDNQPTGKYYYQIHLPVVDERNLFREAI